MDAIGWLVLLIVLALLGSGVFLTMRMRQRSGGIIAGKDKP